MGEEGDAAAEAPAGRELMIAVHLKAGTNLTGIAKTVDGKGFAFTHLELSGKDKDDASEEEKFGNIEALKDHVHLRYVNLSNNYISDPGPLVAMSHLLSLNLSRNCLTTESLERFRETPLKFLQVLDLSHNRIESYGLGGIFPMLRELYLNDNKLLAKPNAVNLAPFDGSVLKILDLQNNKPQEAPAEDAEAAAPEVITCEGFGAPSLEKLLLTGNAIQSLKGLETLVGVEDLDLSGNPVASLEGLPVEGKLRKLNLRDCSISTWKAADTLKEVTTLKELDLQGNKIMNNAAPTPGGYERARIVFRVPGLSVLDELEVVKADKEAADAIGKDGDPGDPEPEA